MMEPALLEHCFRSRFADSVNQLLLEQTFGLHLRSEAIDKTIAFHFIVSASYRASDDNVLFR